MYKKGALPVEVIAVTILILLVLIVLAIAFREQIAQLFSSFSKLLTGTTESVNTINISRLQ
tara:strand:- start:1639 stop:1821 length:183 start_codon:yes stop_codon:yes gene_type:complete